MQIRDEIIAIVGGITLIGILLWKQEKEESAAEDFSQNGAISIVPTPLNTAFGPEYLTYNQPYLFAPPVYAMVPQQSVGQVGQAVSAYALDGRQAF